MAKNKISEWSATPANNTDVGGIDIAEGCAPSGINNAIREMMAQIKDQQAGTDADNFTVGGNLIVTGTTTLTGVPTAPTASSGTNTTQIATTAFVAAATGTLGTMSTQNANAVAITGGTVAATFTGNVTGNVTGSSGSCTGNAATATSATSATTATTASNALGYNQTWQDVSGSRAAATNYTNSTGRPIFISVRMDQDDGTVTLTVDGLAIGKTGYTPGPVYYTLTAVIPSGSTYRVDTTGGTLSWFELR